MHGGISCACGRGGGDGYGYSYNSIKNAGAATWVGGVEMNWHYGAPQGVSSATYEWQGG